MGGLNINCGDFLADDKAGSPFERVLRDLQDFNDDARRRILAGFDENEYTLIEPAFAAMLIAPLSVYRDRLVAEIGHDDWLRETEREERAGADSTRLKWGDGRGWRLLCARNLITACEKSVETSEPVVICLG